jgi:hypothetical protein
MPTFEEYRALATDRSLDRLGRARLTLRESTSVIR